MPNKKIERNNLAGAKYRTQSQIILKITIIGTYFFLFFFFLSVITHLTL